MSDRSRMITEEEFQRICGPHNSQRQSWLDAFRSKGYLIGFVAVTDPSLYAKFLEMSGADQNLSGYVSLVDPQAGSAYLVAADFGNKQAA
jgi:hypothetical protein